MKTWLFATLQSAIAAMGLAAYFLADNVVLAALAAVLAAGLGIAQPLLAARQGQKLRAYRDRQFQQSIESVDEQLRELLADVIRPPLPHQATVRTVIQTRYDSQAAELQIQYDRVLEALGSAQPDVEELVVQLKQQIPSWSLGAYLHGLAALATGDLAAAYDEFRVSLQQQSDWILPWLGWAATAFKLGRLDEIRTDHPHIRGISLMPYDAGDEDSFLKLSEAERAELTDHFQAAAASLGAYYTIAELSVSRAQIDTSHAELSRVA